MTITAWTVSVDLRYLAAFVALSFAAAFALGAWIRRAQGPRADVLPVAYMRACRHCDMPMPPGDSEDACLIGSRKERARALMREMAAPDPFVSGPLAGGPSPHVDGEG